MFFFFVDTFTSFLHQSLNSTGFAEVACGYVCSRVCVCVRVRVRIFWSGSSVRERYIRW